jgi:hypothetical protein
MYVAGLIIANLPNSPREIVLQHPKSRPKDQDFGFDDDELLLLVHDELT